ncbi:hypothetical protein DL95DRAFT_431812 [Leptodontidium sp. 2 PMI_412]|nr:hypothetical protein DL95DRAFT_431812 [Leptodontidium sp. 2 PMI_412]
MGSSASKATKAASKLPAAATNTARKYPTRTPPTSTTATRHVPEESLRTTRHPETGANETRDGATTADPSDPDPALNARLKTLGPVQPNPTHSNSSTFHSHSASTSSFTDPSLSATQFRPSRSNPLQTIFPTSTTSNPNSNYPGTGTNSDARSGTNPAVSLLTARYRLASEAEDEFAQTGKSTAAKGRQFLDVITLRQILVLRDEKGFEAGEIERMLGLREGVVGRLGRRGVVGVGS